MIFFNFLVPSKVPGYRGFGYSLDRILDGSVLCAFLVLHVELKMSFHNFTQFILTNMNNPIVYEYVCQLDVSPFVLNKNSGTDFDK